MSTIQALMFLYIMLNVIVFWCSALIWTNFSFVNPIVIYENIEMNWVGVTLTTIILNVLLPTISVPYWIYKLLTVGRKDED